ncbi:TetR/AcrR family transcriptional regulator [Conexibacter sp. SYSU D00693]|uniref:TetR/AcrR family transcriptional regulator n=1 Tax=Conexibacter sp. SYSU D00693 TaxID=2812560 RepID=UPI00196B2E66|nr:TetR family transcriptional regulator [Conexibacter sp. SYSU D00693]
MAGASRGGPLDAELVTRAGAALADREGLAALSMRRLATDLGCAAMSLYSHVTSKDELIDRIVDAALADVAPVDPARPWQQGVTAFFTALHELLLARPAIAEAMAQRPTEGPAAARHRDAVLDVLHEGGLDRDTAHELFLTLSWCTLGAALYAAGRHGAGREQFAGGLAHLVGGYTAD